MSPRASAPRRAHGNGWYGFALDLDATAPRIEVCARPSSASTAPPRSARSRSRSRRRGAIDPTPLARYAELGVDRLVLLVRGRNADEAIAAIELAERELVRPLAG